MASKVMNFIRNVLAAVAVIIIIATIACFALKIKPAVVMSGSMEPALHTGSVCFVDTKKADSVGVGDVIAFHIQETYITHRIVEETEEGFITKGDANDSNDMWVVQKNDVEGKTIFSIPYIGYAVRALMSKRGKIIFIGVFIVILLSFFLGKDEDTGEEFPVPAKHEKKQEQE